MTVMDASRRRHPGFAWFTGWVATVVCVNGGNLTELASSPVAIPGGVAPFGIIVD